MLLSHLELFQTGPAGQNPSLSMKEEGTAPWKVDFLKAEQWVVHLLRGHDSEGTFKDAERNLDCEGQRGMSFPQERELSSGSGHLTFLEQACKTTAICAVTVEGWWPSSLSWAKGRCYGLKEKCPP